nr:ribonuclease H-like domain-containing protein [Tanacetum cinerariifolium]
GIQVSYGLGPKETLTFLFLVHGNPQHALKDKGVIDSGCSRHMTGNMSYLIDFEEINGGYVSFGGNPKRGKITGDGLRLMVLLGGECGLVPTILAGLGLSTLLCLNHFLFIIVIVFDQMSQTLTHKTCLSIPAVTMAFRLGKVFPKVTVNMLKGSNSMNCTLLFSHFDLLQTYCCWCKLMLLDDAAEIKSRLLEQSAAIG